MKRFLFFLLLASGVYGQQNSNNNGIFYIDGAKYTTIAAAFSDCLDGKYSGCIIDARGTAASGALALKVTSTRGILALP